MTTKIIKHSTPESEHIRKMNTSSDAPTSSGSLENAAPDTSSIPSTVVDAFETPLQQPSFVSPRLPTLRSFTEQRNAAAMTHSSTPLGNVNAARRPPLPQSPVGSTRSSQLPEDVQAKMKAFHLSRQGAPQMASGRPAPGSTGPPVASPLSTGGLIGGLPQPGISSTTGALVGSPGGFRLNPGGRPPPPTFNSTPSGTNLKLNPKMGLAAKRGMGMGLKLSDATGPQAPPQEGSNEAETGGKDEKKEDGSGGSSLFSKYSEFVDTKTGTLKFKGKATLHGKGVDFSSGSSFSISLDEVDTLDELGKGNYGTVYKVRHSRPQIRRPGQGLAGNRAPSSLAVTNGLPAAVSDTVLTSPASSAPTTGRIMAMKEIRLELDDAKFAAIIMELDILHRCVSPYIVDFYGAFFQEGAVYICMEFMDGGSVDKLYGDGVPENVLRKITYATTMGLRSLKDEHNIIHRDVKPTNILVNSQGHVKICDFGVSGNLVASIAKTNIGCQSYMAPERISGGGVAQAGANPGGGTYSVQSDIWSLGLTIIECALGQYPYPPETYDNIFSQLSVSSLPNKACVSRSTDYELGNR